MPKTNKIGASNLYTNNTGQFGSMAGLAPTTNVRPHITNQKGYKYNIVLNDVNHFSKGCGYFKGPAQGTRCLKSLNLFTNVGVGFRIGSKMLN